MLEKVEERKKINEVLIPANSIFKHMNYEFEFIESSQLDLLFILNHGERRVSPLLNYFIRDGTISNDGLDELASTILGFYYKKWDKLKEVVKIQYDIIHNFSDEMRENVNTEETGQKNINDNASNQSSNTNTRTDNLSSTQTRDLTNSQNSENNEQMQGFNSTSYQNKDKQLTTQTISDSGTISNSNTGTQQNQETTTESLAKESNINSKDSYITTKNVSRIGNIGNITTQQMLNQEIELWKWNFIKQILDDVKDLCGLQLYI